jgi:signal transduction histidine kinase
VGYYFWLNNAGLFGETVGLIFLLTSIYTLLEQPKRWAYWGFFLFCLISVLTSLFFGTWGWVLYGYCTTILVSFDIARVAFLSTDRQKKGVWIIIAGNIFYLLMWMAFSLFLSGVLHISSLGRDVVFDVSMMCIPITYAIFLSYDFGHTNWVLKQKLTDIETLSAEKQSILTTQNETLERQVAERTAALKASQAQLIQSEKLASLGELTAGIAHEIQNPLNFVNNFAEVSAELLDDMKADLQAGKTTEAAEIADDLQVNLNKINHHGQRASAIVKGMLEHSRASTGTKVPTDLNALADEYLRLAYHGLRAKDSSFNATMETHFDPDLPKIEVIPQDIGRVLLNLINNAFYAVNQRNNAVETLHATSLPYQPTVTVTTKKLENAIEISVKDNGNGIPDAIKDKIFQPFFTTKPTGQGTGLGLSLAYDIVTKGHGGTLTVSSIPGTETKFEIHLPIN